MNFQQPKMAVLQLVSVLLVLPKSMILASPVRLAFVTNVMKITSASNALTPSL